MPCNRVMIDGYIGRDLDYGEDRKGKEIVTFDIKVPAFGASKKFDGPTINWFTIRASGYVLKYIREQLKLVKGDYVHLQGRLSSYHVEDEETGKTRRVWNIWPDEIHLKTVGKRHEGKFLDDESIVDPPVL